MINEQCRPRSNAGLFVFTDLPAGRQVTLIYKPITQLGSHYLQHQHFLCLRKLPAKQVSRKKLSRYLFHTILLVSFQLQPASDQLEISFRSATDQHEISNKTSKRTISPQHIIPAKTAKMAELADTAELAKAFEKPFYVCSCNGNSNQKQEYRS